MNRNIIKNYELSFGDLGIQIKFKEDINSKDIKNILYFFENYIKQLDNDCKLNRMSNNTDNKTINNIQN